MNLKSSILIWIGCFSTAFFLLGCEEDNSHNTFSPTIPSVIYPNDNLPTPARIELGKKLFFDPILSQSGTISCGSCHKPAFAFADNVSKSMGENGLSLRNSPGLFNISSRSSYFMDGGALTLELAVISPIEDHTEMALNVLNASERLRQSEYYSKLSKQAYRRLPDPYVISRALSAYIRSITSHGSRYDRYLAGNKHALSKSEIDGMKLFFSKKTMCSSCHSGQNFTDDKFYNVGLYTDYFDLGKTRVTMQPEDNGKFRTPSLRKLNKTQPYMHDGSMSLHQVLQHYNTGGFPHGNKDSRIKPLNLSEEEINNLAAYLLSL
ncbi:MAG: cytochrome-c peroxidase [Flavobacteriales bacterium]